MVAEASSKWPSRSVSNSHSCRWYAMIGQTVSGQARSYGINGQPCMYEYVTLLNWWLNDYLYL